MQDYSHAVLNTVMADSPSGMVLVSPDGRCLRVNRAMSDLLGYEPAEFVERNFRHVTHPDDLERSSEVYRSLQEDGKVTHVAEKRYLHKDGRVIWGHVTWSNVRAADGSLLYIVVQIVDITAMKQQQHALEESSEYLRMAIEASRIGIWSHDLETGETHVDARVLELWARPADSHDHGHKTWLEQIHPEDRRAMARKYEAVLNGGADFEAQHRIILPNGRIRYLRVQTVTRRHADGRPRKIIGTNWDVTDQIESANLLSRAKTEAEQANQAKSMFLANMSHELRTPLNAIIGFSDAMKSGIVNVSNENLVRSYSADIHASGQHLLSIINDLLDLSRIESGRFALEEEEIDLRDVINDAAHVMRAQIRDAGLEFDFDLAADMPPVRGDERALRQILLNLLSNAAKFTPRGGRITCGLRPADEGVRLWVADTGIGIAAVEIPRLMRPFVQIDNVYTRQHQGAGLGLAIVRSLVHLHNGTIAIASRPGEGTQVTVTLPSARMAMAQAALPAGLLKS